MALVNLMRSPERPLWLPYAVAVVAVMAATFASGFVYQDSQSTGLLFALYFGAVTFASWYGGLGPCVLATLLSYLAANWFFLQPRDQFMFNGTVFAYFFVCLAIGVFSEAMKQAVRQAMVSARQIASILDSMPDGFVALDDLRRFTYLNPVAQQLHKRHQPDSLGPPAWHEFPPTSGEIAADSFRQVEQQRAPVEFEHFYVPWKTWFEVKAAPGSRGGMVIYFRDTTERRLAENEQRKLASIVNSSEDAILSIDLEGRITSWNQGAESLYGYTPDEMIGQPISKLIPPEYAHDQAEYLAKIERDESVVHFDTLRRAKDGTQIPVSLSISPIRDSDGRVIGASKIARDITDRKRAEDMLRDADRRKDNFLAVLGHELRNPLAGIASGLQVLDLVGTLPDDVIEIREIMKRQAAQMTRLIGDLLDVSRIASGKIALRTEPLDLVALADQIVSDQQRRLKEKGIELLVDLPDESLWVDGDPARLRKSSTICSTMRSNSLIPAGRSRIRVYADAAREQAILAMRDTGAGLSAESRETLFEPFSQAEETLSRSPTGLGLGLSLAKGLVGLHGGTIEADSNGPGTGSTFTIRLALRNAPHAPADVPPAVSEATATCRGLIIEDDDDVAGALRRLLELKGHEIVVARDGASGVDLARRFQPHIVFCDIGLGGGIDGYGVARALRR